LPASIAEEVFRELIEAEAEAVIIEQRGAVRDIAERAAFVGEVHAHSRATHVHVELGVGVVDVHAAQTAAPIP
jgi:hypothetical protein